MSQFQGKVIDAMAACIISLLDLRRTELTPLVDLTEAEGPLEEYTEEAEAAEEEEKQPGRQTADGEDEEEPQQPKEDASHAPSSPVASSLAPSSPARSFVSPSSPSSKRLPASPATKKREALLDSLTELEGEHTSADELLIDLQPVSEAAPVAATPAAPAPASAADASAAEEALRQQRATADELLSALADMRDDCSLLDEDIPASQSTPMQALPKPDALQHMPVPAMSGSMEPGAAVPHLSSLPPTDYPSNVDEAMAMYHYQQQQQQQVYQNEQQQQQQPPSGTHPSQPPGGSRNQPHIPFYPVGARDPTTSSSWQPDDDAVSRASAASSHRMAAAAAAALESREAEAARLKQKAQRLLRERSELACDLEGLQETLSRMERAVARTREQAQALLSDGSRYSTSDTRRHSAQMSTLSKAVLREKQRRLAARNEVGSLQRQLAKKRAHHEQVVTRLATLKEEEGRARGQQLKAEAAVEEVARLRERLEQCEQAIREAQAGAERQGPEGTRADAQTPREQQRLLEGRLAGLRQAIAQQSRSLSSSDIGQPRKTLLSAKLRGGAAARERAKLLESLAAEHDQSEDGSNIASARTSIEEWGQLTRRLQLLLPEARAAADYTRSEALMEAAKWHAEARAFAAEGRRVERLHQQAVQRREAEREGWRDFQEELKRQRRSGSLVADEDAQAQALRQELDRVQAESDAMLRTERPMRNALQAEGVRLQKLRALAAELGAGLEDA